MTVQQTASTSDAGKTCLSVSDALRQAVTHDGENLYDLSDQSALLVVLLRHFGCTFCRESVAELSGLRRPLEQNGIRLAFVYMGEESTAQEFFASYGLENSYRVNDPDRRLYNAFDLNRCFWRVLGLRVFWRGFVRGAFKRHGFSLPGRGEDEFQMPGAFLVHHGRIEQAFRHHTASDRPDYLALAECEVCDTEPATSM